MDFNTEPIENQQEQVFHRKGLSGFSISLQGASHISHDPPVPCQDAHALRWLEKPELLIAAIADGVGSCPLSHWGARTAVNAALDSASLALQTLSAGRRLPLRAQDPGFQKQMKQVMQEAFRAARDAVEALADSGNQPVFAFQSTLTLAIYDGDCLFHGHVGDDGIVAQLPDGTVEMATRRVKGEEANSVFPLQSGEQSWLFGVVPHVAGFVMATDGVLDSFVATHLNYQGRDYFGGICYSFMENAMIGLGRKPYQTPDQVLREYRTFLLSDSYRSQVVDDLTLVAVVSQPLMKKAVMPQFSMEAWKQAQEKSRLARQKALYKTQPAPSQPSPDSDAPEAEQKTVELPKPGPGASPAKKGQKENVPEEKAPEKKMPEAVPGKPGLRKPRKGFSHPFPFKQWLLVLGIAVLFLGGGILLGRTWLAPVSKAEYQEMAKTCEQLQSDSDGLRKDLADRDRQIESLEEKQIRLSKTIDALRKERSSLWKKVEELKAPGETGIAKAAKP